MLDYVRRLGTVEEGVIDVGPEFFDDEGDAVDANVDAPVADDGGGVALAAGVVEGGDAGGGASAYDFAGVEDFVAGIVTGDDDAADGVAGALPEAAAAEGVIAVVLAGDGGDDGFDHEVLDGLIGSGMPEVASVAEAAGTELGICVACEVIAGEGRGDEDGGVVKRVFEGGLEFFFDGLGRQLDVGTDGAEVGEDAEDARGLFGRRRLGGLRLGLRCVDVSGRRGLVGVGAAGDVGRDGEICDAEVQRWGCGGDLGGSRRRDGEGGLLRVQRGAEEEDGERERNVMSG